MIERQERKRSRDFSVMGVVFCSVLVYWGFFWFLLLFACLLALFCVLLWGVQQA